MRTEPLPDHSFDEAAMFSSFKKHEHSPGETELPSRARRSWQDPSPGKTDFVYPTKLTNIRRESTARSIQPQVNVAQSVKGAVLAVEDRAVLCQVQSGAKLIQISLLPELFPEPPHFGSAFDLSMVTIDGIQQPVITLRQPVAATDDLASRMQAILDDF